MPTSHIFVADKGVSKKVSKLSRRYWHYKKLFSTAKPVMSSAQDTADTATSGCAFARVSLSDADDFSDQDDDSLLETSHSIGLKSDGGGGSVLGVGDSVSNSNLHCQKHPIIFSDYLLNYFFGNQKLLF